MQKSTGFILAGNHRYNVAKQLGYDTLPVEWVDVDDERALRIMLADNRTARLGDDDSVALAVLLAELSDTPEGFAGTGFDGDDLDRLIGDLARDDRMGLDSVRDVIQQKQREEHAEEQRRAAASTAAAPRDNGRNSDGSVWAICPDCGHEFEVKHGRRTPNQTD